ncbi:MAG: hypothetical protein IJ740_06085 [Ruminococcus sp.]|nr:hypothetical protein [Ruminococcus sp.]
MEKTTIFTYLYMKKSGSSEFTKLCDITSYPDLFTPPEKIEISDMSHKQRLYTEGMTDVPDYQFGANYTKASYAAVKESEDVDTNVYQLRFGENGEHGAWQWTGSHFVNILGGELNSKREMQITCYPETEIEEAEIEPLVSGNGGE